MDGGNRDHDDDVVAVRLNVYILKDCQLGWYHTTGLEFGGMAEYTYCHDGCIFPRALHTILLIVLCCGPIVYSNAKPYRIVVMTALIKIKYVYFF